MSRRSDAAAKAIERAIAEGTTELREELEVAHRRIEQLEGTLARIAQIAAPTSPAERPVVVPKPSAPPIDSLPPALREHLQLPPMPAPAVGEHRYGEGDDPGEGRWI